jgi:hypothetical protein
MQVKPSLAACRLRTDPVLQVLLVAAMLNNSNDAECCQRDRNNPS